MTELGVGERQEKEQRNRFWMVVVGLCIPAAMIGGWFGYRHGHSLASGQPFSVDVPFAWAAVILAAIAFLYGCWAYYKAIDEVDLIDNLWGSTAGFYAYGILFGGWYALDFVNAAPPQKPAIVFWISLAVATLTYIYRKWRAR